MKIQLLLILPFFTGCSSFQKPFQKMLEKRANYNKEHEFDQSISDLDRSLLVPTRTEPVVTDVWIHPHELPNGDYFRGGWVRTLISAPRWEINSTEYSKRRPALKKNK